MNVSKVITVKFLHLSPLNVCILFKPVNIHSFPWTLHVAHLLIISVCANHWFCVSLVLFVKFSITLFVISLSLSHSLSLSRSLSLALSLSLSLSLSHTLSLTLSLSLSLSLRLSLKHTRTLSLCIFQCQCQCSYTAVWVLVSAWVEVRLQHLVRISKQSSLEFFRLACPSRWNLLFLAFPCILVETLEPLKADLHTARPVAVVFFRFNALQTLELYT